MIRRRRFTIDYYACYSLEMALNVDHSVSFGKDMPEKTDDVNSRKVYFTNDDIFRCHFNGYYSINRCVNGSVVCC